MTGPGFLHAFLPIQRRHVALVGQLASIQHRLLDQSTGLGYLWSFLNPLLMLTVLWAFFRGQIGGGVPHYALYLLIGLVLFTHFAKSASSGMRALHRMRGVATSVIFPKDLLVYSALLADLPELLISMALVAAICLVSGVPASWAWLALPLVLIIQALLVLWVSLLLSIAYVFVRDLDHIFEVGMRILFFATPIFYGLNMLPPTLRLIVLLNPLVHVIGLARTILLEGRLPSIAQLLAFLTLNAVLTCGAIAIFRRAEPAVLERL